MEEVFAVSSKSEEPVSTEDDLERKTEMMISKLKLKLIADPIRTENFRDRMRFIVHNGLRKLKSETPTGNEEPEPVNKPKKARYSTLVELNKKLSNARTDEDLKSCRLMKALLFNQPEQKSSEQAENIEDGKAEQKSQSSTSKWFSTGTFDQEALSHLDAQFCSLEKIEYL